MPPSPRILRAARLVGWNILLAIAGLALIAGTGEIYLRWSRPFMTTNRPITFVPGVGILNEPNVETRLTNGRDFWTVSRTNSLGFLDREPIDPKRAAASCHISVIGDSFVEAGHVPISDKFHVRLEELAAQNLPNLDITTSAFGFRGTGQANQLPYYDKYITKLSPKILAIVFVSNDFGENSALVMGLCQGWDPDKAPFAYPERTVDGRIKLRMPSPEYRDLPPSLKDYDLRLHHRSIKIRPKSWLYRPDLWAADISYFGDWLRARVGTWQAGSSWQDHIRIAWAEILSRRSRYESFLAEARTPPYCFNPLKTKDLLISKEAFEFTAFALQQFRKRAKRDNVSLLILSEYGIESSEDRGFDLMNAMAEAQGIPVISLYDSLIRRGRSIKDIRWENDHHWNATGHQLAAEALLEYLQQHPEVCAR